MGRYFSLELKSKNQLHNISIQEGQDGVLLEGNLGELEHLFFIEGSLLELKCNNGSLRFDVLKDELKKALNEEEIPLYSE